MKILVFTFVQVIHGKQYPIGVEVSEKEEEIRERARNKMGEIPLGEKFQLSSHQQDNECCYLLTCNLINYINSRQEVIQKYRLNSSIVVIYERNDIQALERYLNRIWNERMLLLEEVRKAKEERHEFYPQAKYLFDLSKKQIPNDCTIRCVIASHNEYEAYKKKMEEAKTSA